MVGEVDVRIASDPRWLKLARTLIDECCQIVSLGAGPTRAMVMAANEALSNVMRHAYGGDRTCPIRIVCRRTSGALEVEIWDRGDEFDPFAQRVPPPDELRGGGRGLFLIRSSVDEGEYARTSGWNRTRLRKRLPGEARREALRGHAG